MLACTGLFSYFFVFAFVLLKTTFKVICWNGKYFNRDGLAMQYEEKIYNKMKTITMKICIK